METFNVKCIKCSGIYKSEDPDPYYCATCEEEKKKIAAEIDKKIKPTGTVMSDLKKYDSLPKVNGFVRASDFM